LASKKFAQHGIFTQKQIIAYLLYLEKSLLKTLVKITTTNAINKDTRITEFIMESQCISKDFGKKLKNKKSKLQTTERKTAFLNFNKA